MQRFFILILTLLSGTFSYAANLNGSVFDAKDSVTLAAVVVTVRSTPERTVTTGPSGVYSITNLAAGTYEVEYKTSGYKTETRSVVIGNEDVILDVYLNTTSQQLGGVSVGATRVSNTENAVVAEIRKSTLVVSGVSSAQISKTMDRNAADVVKRIPGVTIQDDRFITVRGLSDRYNSVWLNDAGAPSAEADKKSFSFDIIPSGLIDRILIFKTPSPELPGDFAGGMVKIYTTSIPTKNTYSFGLSTSYRSGSTGTDFFYNKKSSTDWLGYDNGVRSLPSIVTSEYVKSTQANNSELSKAFGNDFELFKKKQPMDFRVNGSASNAFRLGSVKLGSTIGFTYSNTSTNYNVTRLEYDDTTKQANTNDLQSSNKVNVGLIANVAAVIGNTRLEFKNLYNQIGSAVAVTRTSNPDSFDARGPNEISYAMGYESRATYTSQLTGTHRNSKETRSYTWTLGYTDLYKNQPNLRRIKYTEDGVPGSGVYRAQVPAGSPDMVNGGGRYYASLFENVYSFSHQFTQQIAVGDFKFDVNLGNYLEYKDRSFAARQFGYTLVPSAESFPLFTKPVNEIFADSNVGGKYGFRINEGTADYDKYDATNRLIASFVSVALPISSHIKVVTGVRYEDNVYQLKGKLNQEDINPEIHTRFLLPSINASYAFNTKNLLRVAYGKTINRPEFRETAPFYFYDFDRRAGTYGALYPTAFSPGGDTLKVAQIQNVDVRYEYYPSAGELVQIGAFYKQFRDPIQQVGYNAGGRAFTIINAEKAYVLGAELDVRKNLGFLDDRFNTKLFGNFTVVGNLAVSKSELTIDTAGATRLQPKSPLEGQSNYILNTGLYYQSDSAGLQATLLYNVYGPRAYSLGTIDDGSIGELSFHSLDLTLSKTIRKNFQITAGVQNLLDQSYRFMLDGNQDQKFESTDLLYSRYKPGRYFTLGLRMKF